MNALAVTLFDTMGTWLPIAIDVVIGLIALTCVFKGIKSGVKISLIRLISIVVAFVGCYFVTPLALKLLKVEAVGNFVKGLAFSDALVRTLFFAVEFFICTILIEIACYIVRKVTIRKIMKANSAIRAKRTRQNAKVYDAHKKADLKKARASYKASMRFASRFTGAWLGVVVALIVCAVVMMPCKYLIFGLASVDEGITQTVQEAYDKTPYGMIEKWVPYDSFRVEHLGEVEYFEPEEVTAE